MKKILFVILLILVLVTIAAVVLTQQPAVDEQVDKIIKEPVTDEEAEEKALLCDADKISRLKIINEFEKQWGEFEQKISVRPVLGAGGQPWQIPTHYQFIGNDRKLIAFEDGHIIIMAIIEYSCINGLIEDFSLVQDGINQPDGFPFIDKADWNEIIKNYGDKEHPIYTYVKSIVIEGDLIEFDEWTETEQNIFVK